MEIAKCYCLLLLLLLLLLLYAVRYCNICVVVVKTPSLAAVHSAAHLDGHVQEREREGSSSDSTTTTTTTTTKKPF